MTYEEAVSLLQREHQIWTARRASVLADDCEQILAVLEREHEEAERGRAILPVLDGLTGRAPTLREWAMICDKARQIRDVLAARRESDE